MIYCIYALVNKLTGEPFYIGSTKDLGEREDTHRKCCSLNHSKSQLPVYVHIRLIGTNNWTVQHIREIDVASRIEAQMHEQIEFDKFPRDQLMNVNRPRNSVAIDNEKRRAYGTIWRTTNPDYYKNRLTELKKDPIAWARHLEMSRKKSAKYANKIRNVDNAE